MHRSMSGISSWLLTLAVLASCPGHGQSTAASAPSARTQALRDIETSQASSLDAIPASVDESLDMRVQADVQKTFRDPSLTGLDTGEPDARVKGSSISSGDGQVRSRPMIPTATSWGAIQTVAPLARGKSALFDAPEQGAEKPMLSPVEVIAADPGNRTLDSGVSDSGTNSSRPAKLSRAQIEQRDRSKRQARILQKSSDRQCSQLRSGETECRLKLDKANPAIPHSAPSIGQ
jgi:hypothetical protein